MQKAKLLLRLPKNANYFGPAPVDKAMERFLKSRHEFRHGDHHHDKAEHARHNARFMRMRLELGSYYGGA